MPRPSKRDLEYFQDELEVMAEKGQPHNWMNDKQLRRALRQPEAIEAELTAREALDAASKASRAPLLAELRQALSRGPASL